MAGKKTKRRAPAVIEDVPVDRKPLDGAFVLRLRESRRIAGKLRAPEFVLARGRLLAGVQAVDIDKAVAAGEVYAAVT